MQSLVRDYGLFILFVLIAMESAGIPLPGETALAAAGVLASHGDMSIVAVITVAAVAAIIGDNVGYWVGRLGGRKLLQKSSLVDRHASRVLPWSERFFQRHGGKTIFLARFVAVLRVTAAWIAGISKMHWWQFFLWNAAGGIVWAVAVGLVAYYVGEAAAAAIGRWGLIAGAAIFVLLVAGALVFRFIRRRMLGAESGA
jgi:membrane protein DedA with SNARE-associated domain